MSYPPEEPYEPEGCPCGRDECDCAERDEFLRDEAADLKRRLDIEEPRRDW